MLCYSYDVPGGGEEALLCLCQERSWLQASLSNQASSRLIKGPYPSVWNRFASARIPERASLVPLNGVSALSQFSIFEAQSLSGLDSLEDSTFDEW